MQLPATLPNLEIRIVLLQMNVTMQICVFVLIKKKRKLKKICIKLFRTHMPELDSTYIFMRTPFQPFVFILMLKIMPLFFLFIRPSRIPKQCNTWFCFPNELYNCHLCRCSNNMRRPYANRHHSFALSSKSLCICRVFAPSSACWDNSPPLARSNYSLCRADRRCHQWWTR